MAISAKFKKKVDVFFREFLTAATFRTARKGEGGRKYRIKKNAKRFAKGQQLQRATRQVYGLEPQLELSARAEEEISEQTHYPYIHLLQCFHTSLAGISEQLLQEPRQSLGWVLGAALPLFPFLHYGSANRHKAQVSCTPEGTLSRSREVRVSLGRGHFPKHSSDSPNSQGP